MSAPRSYQGGSAFFRWWPRVLCLLALLVLIDGWTHSIQWATFLVAAAYVHSRWLPYQFNVLDDGLMLAFPFGRRLFLPKAALSVRIDVVGAIALVGQRRRFGYPLVDRILYEPGRSAILATAFNSLGYDVR